MQLRPYQQEAFDTITAALKTESNVLAQAPCSFGKTILFSHLIKHYINKHPHMRFLILAHQDILVTQARDKLVQVAPELKYYIGIACASVQTKKDLSSHVTIASRQTLINQIGNFEPYDLIIVDEAHLVSVPRKERNESQYETLINYFREINPKSRLLGVTGTPYRLSDGYIYGDANHEESSPYFNELHYKAYIDDLTEKKYLAPLRGKVAKSDQLMTDLRGIKITGGDYNQGDLSGMMVKEVHITSAIDAYNEHAKGRRKTMVFAVTISHAIALHKAFEDNGTNVTIVHSKMSKEENEQNLAMFGSLYEVIINVAKLTTGLDIPDIDCILLARPTKSASLYVQILGRGMRIADGKEDCLIIDLTNNTESFGTDLDEINVKIPGKKQDKDPPIVVKVCPECKETVHPKALICPSCDFKWENTIEDKQEVVEVKKVTFGRNVRDRHEVADIRFFRHQKVGKPDSMRVEYHSEGFFNTRIASEWVCFNHEGFARTKAEQWWRKMTWFGNDVPYTVDQALDRTDEITTPHSIETKQDGRYTRIIKRNLKETF